MTTRTAWAALFVWLLASTALADGARLRFLRDGELVSEVDLDEMKKTCQVAAVVIEDPYYKRQKSYLAFSLKQILKLGFGGAPEHLAKKELSFQATDGYSKPAPAARALEDGGYLAFADADRMKGDDPGWEAIDRRGTSPAPFYVVWSKPGQGDANGYPWPYALASIEIVHFEKRYPHVQPSTVAIGSAAWRGFQTFKEQCLSCHSINGEGGKIGPDLNVPKGILEYRPAAQVKQYIRNPEAFRYSNMPAHEGLSEAALDDLLAYFSTMQGLKHDPRKER